MLKGNTLFSLVSIVALFVAFWYIGEELEYHEKWGLDVVVELNKYRTQSVTTYLKILSFFGYELFVPFLMFFVWSSSRKNQQFAMGYGLLLTECFWLQSVLKLYYERPRPWHPSLDLNSSSTTVSELYSYPSGHSFASTVAWFAVSGHLNIPSWVPVIVVTLVGISRVSLAVHFPHDVISGIIMGLIFLLLWNLFLNIDGESTSKSMKKPLVAHWLLIICILASNYYFSSIILKVAPTGMLYGPIFCLGILIGILFHSPWVGKNDTYLESLFRYLVGVPIAWTPFFVLDIFHMKKGEIEPKILGLVLFLPIWLFFIAPHVFVKFGIAKWRTEESEARNKTVKSKNE